MVTGRKYWQHSFAPGAGGDELSALCARGERCAASRTDPETGERRPAPATQHLCLADRAILEQSLADFPGCYDRLSVLALNPVKAGRAVRVPPGSRVLANPEADALMRESSVVAGGWAARVRAVPQLSLARSGHAVGTPGQVAADCNVLRLHVDPLLALPVAPMTRTWTWPFGNPMPEELDEVIGTLDAVRGGDGWVTAWTELHGGDAACELIDLKHRAVRLLREGPAIPETFDGVPCRDCEAMGSLERAPLPAGPEDEDNEPAFSRCVECRETMTLTEFRAWTSMYAAWTKGSGILTCARCEAGNCGNCQWAACSCRASGHVAAMTSSR